MLFDEELQDETRLDRERIDKEMLDVVSVALRRRVYTVDEQRIISKWNRASFSTDIHERANAARDRTTLMEERHRYDMWPRLTEPARANKFDLKVRPLTRQEIEFGFATMTALATKLGRNKQLKVIVNAKTATARAYQAAELVLRLYRFDDRRYVDPTYLRAARIVHQRMSHELLLRDYEKRIEQVSKGRRKRGPSRLQVIPFILRLVVEHRRLAEVRSRRI